MCEEDSAKLPWLLGKQAQNSCVRLGLVDTRVCLALSPPSCAKTETGFCFHQGVPADDTLHSPRQDPGGRRRAGWAFSALHTGLLVRFTFCSSATFPQVKGRVALPQGLGRICILGQSTVTSEKSGGVGSLLSVLQPRPHLGCPASTSTAGSLRGQSRCSCCRQLSRSVSLTVCRTQHAFPTTGPV